MQEPEKIENPEALVRRWIKEIDHVEKSKRRRAYEKIGEKIVKNYANISAIESVTSSNQSPTRVMYNVVWSNVQVLKPALYSRIPKIVVERRFKDADPIGNLASRMAERGTSFVVSSQQDRFHHNMRMVVEDRLLPGAGFGWIRYEVETDQETDPNGEPIGEPTIRPNTEKVYFDYVHWKDFFWSEARNWFDVRWIARRVHMTRNALIKRFGETGKLVSIEAETRDDKEDLLDTACVYEIHDKETKSVYWISPQYKDAPLDIKKDPMKLRDFWPAPMPLLATTTTDSMYPTPDVKIYERLAEEIDSVTKRISAMADCIRLVGATAKTYASEVKSMLKLRDGELWPIDQWIQFTEKGGFDGVIDWLPFEQCVAAIGPLQQYQAALISQCNEISSIPDVVRGNSDPEKTAAAIQRESRWTVLKLSEKQADVQRFAREAISKIAEMIFEPGFFTDETIRLICGADLMSPEDQQNFPAALALLRDDRLNTFRVDIETDSTIAADEDEDKASRMEYLNSMTQLFSNMPQVPPALLEPMVESALFATRAFRSGRQLEGAWEKSMRDIQEQAKNPPPPPPDYQQLQLQVMQTDSQTKQMEAQTHAQEAQMRMQSLQVETQSKMAEAQAKTQQITTEAQARDYVAQLETQLKQAAQQFTQYIETQKLQLETQKASQEYDIKRQQVEIEAAKVMTKDQVDKMKQEQAAAQALFDQEMEKKRLELDRYETVLSEREKLLEEKRLAGEQTLEAVRLMSEKQQPPVVHVHVPPSKPRVTQLLRDATGVIQGSKSSEVETPQEEVGDTDAD